MMISVFLLWYDILLDVKGLILDFQHGCPFNKPQKQENHQETKQTLIILTNQWKTVVEEVFSTKSFVEIFNSSQILDWSQLQKQPSSHLVDFLKTSENSEENIRMGCTLLAWPVTLPMSNTTFRFILRRSQNF